MSKLSHWELSSRESLIEEQVRSITRLAAAEGWFRQIWFGVEVWQIPEDLINLQALIFEHKPRWIIETGTKYGGSAIFFASILAMLNNSDGGVLTIDIEVKREALETFKTHQFGALIKLSLEGDAASPDSVAKFHKYLSKEGSTGKKLIFLDDNHSAEHVLTQLMLYSELCSVGDLLIAADTSYADLVGTDIQTRSAKYSDLDSSNPRIAVEKFLREKRCFERIPMPMPFGPSNFPDGILIKKY